MSYRNNYGEPSKPIIISIIIVMLIVLGVALKRTWAKIHQPAKQNLVVGVNTPFPPFEIKNGENIEGFDVDLAVMVTKALNSQLVVKDMSEFDALLPTLEAGGFDVVVSAVSVSPEREEVVSFSDSYYASSQGVLMRKADHAKINTPKDFTELRVAYEKGTTSENWVKTNLEGKIGIGGFTVFTDISYAIQMLRFGSIDAIVTDKPAAVHFANDNLDLSVAGVIQTGEKYAFAVAKNDPQKILPVINQVLAEAKKNGEYQKLLTKWFGGEQQ